MGSGFAVPLSRKAGYGQFIAPVNVRFRAPPLFRGMAAVGAEPLPDRMAICLLWSKL